jgi:hypothetical protein
LGAFFGNALENAFSFVMPCSVPITVSLTGRFCVRTGGLR